jgi:hypothetical protein
MTTPARYRALQWFLDPEVLGRTEMLTRTPPSARMRKLMAKENEVYRIPVGQLEHYQWRLTAQGREKLLNKPKVRRRSLPRIHAKEDA